MQYLVYYYETLLMTYTLDFEIQLFQYKASVIINVFVENIYYILLSRGYKKYDEIPI